MRSQIHSQSSQVQYDKFKVVILGRMMIISVIFTLFFAILDTLEVNSIGTIQASINYLHALAIFPSYILFKQKKINLAFSANIFLLFCFITSIFALFFASLDSFRAIWFFLSTIIAFIFCGQSIGRAFGLIAFISIFSAGFLTESSINSVSVVSSLVGLTVLTLVMSSFTGQIQKHLLYIDRIQQELNYLANKTAISNAINTDEETLKAEKLLSQAQKAGDDIVMYYVDIDHHEQLKAKLGDQSFELLKEQLTEKIKTALNKNDMMSHTDGTFIYVLSPYTDVISAKQFAHKLQQMMIPLGFIFGQSDINITLSISITLLAKHDTSIRSLHIRADQGLTKIKSTGGNKIIVVEAS